MTSVASGANLGTATATRRRRYMDRKSLIPLLIFVPPSLILFTLFVVLPMVDAATFSFFDWNGYGPITDFVGLKNYEDVVTHRNFGTAVRNSAIRRCDCVPLDALVTQLDDAPTVTGTAVVRRPSRFAVTSTRANAAS